jgi:phosphatidylinositol alpha-1,6-mannosyltransferase
MCPSRYDVWVLTPELHREGGTELSIAEQIGRWRTRFNLRTYTMRVRGEDLSHVAGRRLPWLPAPHLLRYLWWLAANQTVRRWDRLRLGLPDAVYSPGINCLDADVMSVHIVFAKHWERVRSQMRGALLRPHTAPRTLHQILYWRMLRSLERRVYSGPATIWAMSKEDARELETRFGRPPGSVPEVPHGVDTVRFSPAARSSLRAEARQVLGVERKRVLLVVANDPYKKGVDTAIGCLKELPKDVVLAIAGHLDARAIQEWAHALGVGGRVEIWTPVADVMSFYAAADVMVAPSREDAFGLPPLEAMACGLPVVVSERAGVSELIEDGRDALIVHDPENPAALARAVRRILDLPDMGPRLGTNGRALAERHSWDTNAERAAALIEREVQAPRFLVLAPDLGGRGGIQRVSRTLLRALADLYGPERNAVLPVWSSASDSALPGRIPRPGRQRTPGGTSFFQRLAYLLNAVRVGRHWRKRLVVFCCHPSLAPVALACHHLSGAPYAVWCHGMESWGDLSWPIRLALRRADAVFAPSRFTAQRVEATAGLRERSVRVIPHCVPPETAPGPSSADAKAPAKGSSPPAPIVLAVARLVPGQAYKGVDTLLWAWPRVTASVPDAVLVVVGDGKDRPRLERMAALLGLNGRVRFAGHVPDEELRRLYGQAVAFALPGRSRLLPTAEGEGFGLVFVEAGASGLPVVAGRGGAVSEVVSDGESGLLVDPGRTGDVSEAIVRLLREPALARRLGDGGRARAARDFTYDRFRDAVGDLVRTLRSQQGVR